MEEQRTNNRLMARCGNCNTIFCFSRTNTRELLKCYSCGMLNQTPADTRPDSLRTPQPKPKQGGAGATSPSVVGAQEPAEQPSTHKQHSAGRERVASIRLDDDQFESDLKKALELSMQPPEDHPETSVQDDLSLAVALSLQSVQQKGVDLTADNDDELRAALEASMQEAQSHGTGYPDMDEDEMIRLAIARSLQSAEAKMAREGRTAPEMKKAVSRTIERMLTIQKTDDSLSDLEIDSAR
eukprot:c17272_g1_i1.p1 GENE.c17272_g1_i1~~c17272_g1_i1.p1  ORF type:complete len:240 (+),score=51.66 c17272_g1_i1:44-763(+)